MNKETLVSSFLTRRVKTDLLIRKSRPASSRGAGEHQLVVVEEGRGAGGARQHQMRRLQRLLALRTQDVEDIIKTIEGRIST